MVLTGVIGDGTMLPVIHCEGNLDQVKYLKYLDE